MLQLQQASAMKEITLFVEHYYGVSYALRTGFRPIMYSRNEKRFNIKKYSLGFLPLSYVRRWRKTLGEIKAVSAMKTASSARDSEQVTEFWQESGCQGKSVKVANLFGFYNSGYIFFVYGTAYFHQVIVSLFQI